MGGLGGETAGHREADLLRLREALARHRLVNLTGPPGIGKTWLAARLGATETVDLSAEVPAAIRRLRLLSGQEQPLALVVVDGVTTPAHAAAVHMALSGTALIGSPPRVLVVSRVPLRATPEWPGGEPAAVPPGPLSSAAVDAPARRTGPVPGPTAVPTAGPTAVATSEPASVPTSEPVTFPLGPLPPGAVDAPARRTGPVPGPTAVPAPTPTVVPTAANAAGLPAGPAPVPTPGPAPMPSPEPVTVPLGPLSPEAVDTLAHQAGVTEPDARALVVRLAGGVPLLAAAACRALHAGTGADAPGAVADRVVDELLGRLAPELPGRRWQHALRLLATVGAADETLLTGGPDLFAALGRLSLVTRGPLGLTVREPYRTVLELAHGWRRPTAHQAVRARAAAYRRDLLARQPPDAPQRAALVEQGLFLTGDPQLRHALFPPAEPPTDHPAGIAPAQEADADDIARLMDAWARRGGFDPRRARRLAESWLGHGVSSFHLARDRDGRPLGLTAMLPMGEDTADGAELVLQQHTEQLTGWGASRGLLLGAAYCPEPATHARILRYTLRRAMASGHLVVSTASPGYQTLVKALGFRSHGGVHDDLYRCGRPPEVFSNDFTGRALDRWLTRLGPAPGVRGDTVEQVAWALARIRDPRALAASPLVGSPACPTTADLRTRLYEAVLELAAGETRADAEAGAILQAYHLGRARSHHQVATRFHLSRATYFRRLRHGLEAVAARIVGPGGPEVT